MNKLAWYTWLMSGFIGFFALALIYTYSCWQVALGVFLAGWALNLDNKAKTLGRDDA